MYTQRCISLLCILVLVSSNAALVKPWSIFNGGDKTSEDSSVTSSESSVKVTKQSFLNGTSTNISFVGDIYEATVAAIKANETEAEKNKVKDEGKNGSLVTTTPTTSTLSSSTGMTGRIEESTTTTSKAPMTNSLSTPSVTTLMAPTTTTTVKTTSLAPNPNDEDHLKKELDTRMKEHHDQQSQATNTDVKKEIKTESTTKVINTAGYGSGSTKPESLVNTVLYFLISCLLYRLSV